MDDLQEIMKTLKQIKSRSHTNSFLSDDNLIYYLIHKTQNFKEVKWVLNELISLGLVLRKQVLKKFLPVVEDYEDALYMLGLKVRYDIQFDIIDYSRLLGSTDNMVEAETILDNMINENIEFKPLIYLLLIEKSSSYYEAKNYFEEMRSKNFILHSNIYHCLLAKMDSNNLDNKILDEMSDLGFVVDEALCKFYQIKSSIRTNEEFRKALSEKFMSTSISNILETLDNELGRKSKGKKTNTLPSLDVSGNDWSKEDVALIVCDYFDMLLNEINGQTYSKTEHCRVLKEKLNNRSEGAIEFKHQNISAVLVNNDLPFISGYKPRYNDQELLKDIVIERFKVEILDKYNENEISENENLMVSDLKGLLEQAPETSPMRKDSSKKVTPGKPDFAEKERNNKRLGMAGEKLVVKLERQKLIDIGRADLAKEVSWVSENSGDGLGYDVLSFDESGNEILIEVKTTSGGKSMPFYISDNELAVLSNNLNNYYIYRVFDFRKDPKVFILSTHHFLKLFMKPQNYIVYPSKSNSSV